MLTIKGVEKHPNGIRKRWQSEGGAVTNSK
jgi:hypothetical protein